MTAARLSEVPANLVFWRRYSGVRRPQISDKLAHGPGALLKKESDGFLSAVMMCLMMARTKDCEVVESVGAAFRNGFDMMNVKMPSLLTTSSAFIDMAALAISFMMDLAFQRGLHHSGFFGF